MLSTLHFLFLFSSLPRYFYVFTQFFDFALPQRLSVLLILPDDKASRLDYTQTRVQVAFRLCEATIAAWIGVTGRLELLSWIFALLSPFHSSTEHKSSRMLLSLLLLESDLIKILSIFPSFSLLTSFFFIIQPPCCSGQGRLACAADMKKDQCCKLLNRWLQGLMLDDVPFSMKHCSAKRAPVTVQQIQGVTTVAGGGSKQLFREVLHVCLW